MTKKIFLILCFLSLGGCQLGPKYRLPCMDIPEEWTCQSEEYLEKTSSEMPEACVDYWWEIFEDDLLNELEILAIANNRDLYVALERVIEARALAGVKEADLFPQITLTPSYTDSGQLFQFFIPPAITPIVPGQISSSVFRIHQFQYALPLNLNYEVDLWRKIQGQYESAYMSAEAEEEAMHVTALGLTTDLASSYFQARSLDAQIDYLEKTIVDLDKNYQLTKSRFEKGIANYIDVSQSASQLFTVEATLEDTIRQRVIQVHRIAILLGMPPARFCLPTQPLTASPPKIPVGIPATILLQRPDVAEAERNMASQHALIGVAYASFLPSLSITGTIGYISPTLEDFLTWLSRYWLMGANVNQSVFDGGRNISNLEAAYASFRETSGEYQQTILTAFQEVEDALNNLEMQEKQAESLSLAAEWSNKSLDLSKSRYKNGIAEYLEVLISERTALDNERNYIFIQGVRYVTTIQLIKAMGGTW